MKKKFYIFFTKARTYPWYCFFLNRKISHCFTLEHQVFEKTECFIKLENLNNIIETNVYFTSLYEIFKLMKDKKNYKTLELEINVNPLKKTSTFLHLNCVNMIKKSLGINKRFIFTPKQLLKHLLKLPNCKEI